LAIGSAVALVLRFAPVGIWTTFLGPQFGIAGNYGLSYLVALYAITAVIYSLSVVIMAYEMSYKIANTSWVQLAFGGVVIAGICRFHSSLQEVIWVQLVLMVILLAVVGTPFLLKALTGAKTRLVPAGHEPVQVVRRISEDEVIAEFLKNDIRNPAFEEYQEVLHGLVTTIHFDDAAETAKRRALLFIRHGSLWRELPKGTEWFEVEIRAEDLCQIRVFPRAQWRKIARGNFTVTVVAEQMRRSRSRNVAEDRFRSKLGCSTAPILGR
jgi:hypothetical protein